jgi:hypothetical protein
MGVLLGLGMREFWRHAFSSHDILLKRPAIGS